MSNRPQQPRRPDSGPRRVTFSETAPPAAVGASLSADGMLPSALPPPPPPASGPAWQAPPGGDEEADQLLQDGASDRGAAAADGGDAAAAAAASPGWLSRFRASVKALKREVLAIYYAIHDPRTPWTSKLLPWLALAYALSPLDLIPDFIPVLGLLDDMLLLPGLLWLAVKLIPPEIMEDARARAHAEPLLLHSSWAAATFVFASWSALALLLAHFGFQRWADADTQPYEWAVLAGTAGVCTIAFVTWLVTGLRYERRRRDEWSAALNASLLPPA